MPDLVLRIENISKRYRLGLIGRTALHEDLSRWWAKLRGQPDPTMRLDQLQILEARKAEASELTDDADHVWALRDVSFEVRQGEILGIIGKNGAGKSTLLKILSRVTAPTLGNIKVKGRIASLLEVGTGFHPELTGRENIFLNGAILGMSKTEVRSKFDEIVAFAELEKFIDTPVKRYSSGMYVRLAFAVAAHLEPEILVVDEVLAVGDAAFQKKCLGKMKDVAKHGRTVLFVSHNMAAVRSLCERGILLHNGTIEIDAKAGVAIDRYIGSSSGMAVTEYKATDCCTDDGMPKLLTARLVPKQGSDVGICLLDTPIDVLVEVWNPIPGAVLHLNLLLYTEDGTCVLNTFSDMAQREEGLWRARCEIPGRFLNSRSYSVRLLLVRDQHRPLCDLHDVLTFSVHETDRNIDWFGNWPGVVRPSLTWKTLNG